ncbi:uncharacterized protein SCHCODRAFT_02576780 [Schizophyllum commune H4-8]|nr:uncharacterized protein SCHCODRAFT_02576780 [Schizophyllum commune H4-8]KAI5894118.1 hypothetical protein SCHCODRAFT_02576780 [Schizophyllum commune H4-8]
MESSSSSQRAAEMADQFSTHRVFRILLPQGFTLTFYTTVPGKLAIRPAYKKYDETIVQVLTSEDRAKKLEALRACKAHYRRIAPNPLTPPDGRLFDWYFRTPDTSIPAPTILGQRNVEHCAIQVVDIRALYGELFRAIALNSKYREVPVRGEVLRKLLDFEFGSTKPTQLVHLKMLQQVLSPADWAELNKYDNLLERRVNEGYRGYKGFLGHEIKDVSPQVRASRPETGEYPWVAKAPTSWPVLPSPQGDAWHLKAKKDELRRVMHDTDYRRQLAADGWKKYTLQERERQNAPPDVTPSSSAGAKRSADDASPSSSSSRPSKRQRLNTGRAAPQTASHSHGEHNTTQSAEDRRFHTVPAAWDDIPERYRTILVQPGGGAPPSEATEAGSSTRENSIANMESESMSRPRSLEHPPSQQQQPFLQQQQQQPFLQQQQQQQPFLQQQQQPPCQRQQCSAGLSAAVLTAALTAATVPTRPPPPPTLSRTRPQLMPRSRSMANGLRVPMDDQDALPVPDDKSDEYPSLRRGH